jgi:hypothetical protein
MKLITNHRVWWSILIVATLIVSVITSQEITLTGIIISMLGHLVFSFAVATLPWIVYWLIKKPLNTEQMMTAITIGWLILAVANLSVMP